MSTKKLILFLIFISSFVSAQECISILDINTNKESSLIFINDEFIGYGKIRMDVQLGKYKIVVKDDLYRWNESEINDSVNIKLCDKEYLIRYNLLDKIFVDSDPQNAAIFVYDSLMAYTPNFVSVNQFHTVNMKKNGMNKIVNSDILSVYNKIPLDVVPQTNNKSFTDSDWFKVLVGTATIFGAGAAYYKIKADNIYDDYLKTKDNSLLDRVDKYDFYSGIFFGLLQINFGYLIYKFLIE